jgi:hypothetical protein
MFKHPGHDFAKISILHDRELLDGRTKLVTTDPMPEVMTAATGMPPHVGTAQQLARISFVLTDLVQKFGEHGINVMKKKGRGIGHKSLGTWLCYGELVERNIGELPRKQC